MMIAALLGASLAGCARKPRPDETPEEFSKYRKAFHSAEVVYGIDALGDLIEILKNSGIIAADGAKAAIGYTDQSLIGVDEITMLLEQGLPVGRYDKARAGITAFKNAVAAGAIKFTSPEAQQWYFNVVSTVEVSINLAEAYAAGNQKDVNKYASQRARAVRDLQEPMTEPWWNAAIVRATRLATDISGLSPLTAADIWPQVRARSIEAHAENASRKASW